MARASNLLIGISNTIILLLSISLIGTSIYFHVHGGTECDKTLQKPFLVSGIVVFVVSFIGLIGSCCRSRSLMLFYMTVLGLAMAGVFAVSVFTVLVTSKFVGEGYSHWLRKYAVSEGNWGGIRSCLVDAQICAALDRRAEGLRASDFYENKLSSIESGCCTPPTNCGFTYKNATNWEAPKSGPKASDPDCKTWSNDPKKLCYDCKSCKEGVMANIRRRSKYMILFNFGIFCGMFLLYCIALSAYHDNKYKKFIGYDRT